MIFMSFSLSLIFWVSRDSDSKQSCRKNFSRLRDDSQSEISFVEISFAMPSTNQFGDAKILMSCPVNRFDRRDFYQPPFYSFL